MQAMTSLEQLDLWGSKITNVGARCLSSFKHLKSLNVAMTSVTRIPQMISLVSLNLCTCAVDSITSDSPLTELFLTGSLVNLRNAISCTSARNVQLLDLANSHGSDLEALAWMPKLSILDFRATGLTDALVTKFPDFGKSLKWLDLGHTKVSSEGVAAIAGYLPKLEQLSLSHTLVDDNVFVYLIHFPSLQSLDLSGSKVKGTDSTHLLQILKL